MFAGSQIMTAKIVHGNQQKEIIDNQNEDKTAEDLVNISVLVPRPKAAIFAENSSEKIQRKVLVEERKHERIVEQQKMIQQMNNLMKQVIHETSLSKTDENNLRNKMKTIMNKVNKESDPIDMESQIKSQSDQGPFLLWHDKNFHR